jgi:hypothetical protein
MFFLVLTASAAPVPKHLMKEPVYYHPTEAGSKWVYRYYSAEDEVGRDVIEVVTAMIEPKGGEKGVRVAELGSVFDGKEQGSGCYTAISSKGLVEGYVAAGGNFVPRAESLRVSATPGTSWENTVGTGQTGRTEKHTFRGEETIEVPAGKFRALRVDTEFTYNAGGRRVWRRWYAPGVGMVKLEDSNGPRKVLKEFTPGKK